MTANFWNSSHYKRWLIDRSQLELDKAKHHSNLTKVEQLKINFLFADVAQNLSLRLRLHQQVVATSIVYFRRFYAANSYQCISPLLLCVTSVYLAAKVEESGSMSMRTVVQHAALLVKSNYAEIFGTFPYDVSEMVECEFFLLEEMQCFLILYQPYRELESFLRDLGQYEELYETAWYILNDSLRTDVWIIHYPYIICLASIYLATIFNMEDQMPEKTLNWFADLNVDMTEILDVVKDVLDLYDVWKESPLKRNMPQLMRKIPAPVVEHRDNLAPTKRT
eukprot:Clim_evm91s152 gene=Clim_evmTU91s152